jgi:ribose 5-phosphate isomerase B
LLSAIDYIVRVSSREAEKHGAKTAQTMAPVLRMAREHNDANILVLGARVIGPELMRENIEAFARASFTPGNDGRHARRVAKLNAPLP